LAAILFPVFAQAKLSAKRAASLSEVKQIGTSYAIYMGDNDDHMLPYLWYNRGDGVFITWMEMLHPYGKNKEIYLHNAAPTDQASYGESCDTTANPKVVSHYVMPMWINYSYWDWFGTVMWSGFPAQANNQTTCSGDYVGCVEVANVEGPSNTAVLIPGYFITYNRPAPALESTSIFGAACTTGFAPDAQTPPTALQKSVHVFADGANYGMADSSAKWMPTKRFNKDNSRVFAFEGDNYQASPYMFVK
jgi:hypothetical protein